MSKKIKLTEKQAYLIQDIMKEDEPTTGVNLDFKPYHQILDKAIIEIDKYYNKLLQTTPDQAIHSEPSFYHKLQMRSYELSNSTHSAYKKVQFEISKLTDDQYYAKAEKLDNDFDDKLSLFNNKRDVVDSLAEIFEKIVTDYNEEEWNKFFPEKKPMDITHQQGPNIKPIENS